MTRQLVVSLLNHIRAFSDWAQCFVLELVTRYQPSSEEERFDILEVRLHASGVPHASDMQRCTCGTLLSEGQQHAPED
jgi:hypothetical protein